MKKDFLSTTTCSPAELKQLLKTASQYATGKKNHILSGKNIALYFETPSTRTKLAFDVGIQTLGGGSISLAPAEMQVSRGESLETTAKIISQYVDGLVARVQHHTTLELLAKNSTIPVVNALSDLEHPTQAIADLLTIQQAKGSLKGLKLVWFGDGNNVCQSLMSAAAKLEMHVVICTPPEYKPKVQFFDQKNIMYESNPKRAVALVDILVTDTWTSMAHQKNPEKIRKLQPYQVNERLACNASEDYVFLHCLPAYPGQEVVESILHGSHSLIWQEAKNKMYAQMAVLEHCLT